MRLAKSIDELYEEVKDYDMVLCNDAPLATALNNRIQRPFVGEFAVTPRQLAGDLGSLILKGPVLDDIDIIRIVSEMTGYTLRFVHGEIENIKRIRRYTKDVEGHLHGRSKKVFDQYIKLKTTEKAMEMFDGETNPIYKDKRVAVIGTELFDELDKFVNPKFGTFEEIDVFKRGKYTLPEIREVGNNREIAENIASLITTENCRDVAIVMNVGGAVSDSIKSALYKNRIPFINRLIVKDLKQTRDFLEFISLSLSFDYLKIGQIREIVANYGGYIKARYDNYLAKDFDLKDFETITDDRRKSYEKTMEVLSVMKNIRGMTFEQVKDRIVDPSKKGQVKLLLEEVGVLKDKVSNEKADDLFYAVNNINDLKHNEQIPDHEKEGVLLTDCTKAVYVDRPIVFFVCIDADWEKDLSFLNDIDYRLKDDEVDRNVERFQVLLQQGERRVYVVNSMKGGNVATPCSYFDHCSTDGAVCKTFADVCDKVIKGPWLPEYSGEPPSYKQNVSIDDSDDVFVFSNSTYSSFVNCPRAFMFGRLLDDPDKDSTLTGNYLHAYAEYRAAYPDAAMAHDIEYYVDFISDRCLCLYTPEKRILERSVLRASITNINEFIDGMHIAPTFVRQHRMDRPNPFFDETMEVTSDQTELKLSVADERIEGIIDLISDKGIFDYKSGKTKKGKEISKEMSKNGVQYGHNFQPMFYIHMMDKDSGNEHRRFGFFYTRGNINNFTQGAEPKNYLYDNIRNVYLVDSLEDFYINHYLDRMFRDEKYADDIDYKDSLISVLTDYGLENAETISNNKELIKAVGGSSTEAKRLVNHIGSDFKKINKILEENGSFYIGNSVYFTLDAMTEFLKDLAIAHARYEEYLDTEFPAIPKVECKNCNFKDVCTATPMDGGEEDVADE